MKVQFVEQHAQAMKSCMTKFL